jgi:hypothetical protein
MRFCRRIFPSGVEVSNWELDADDVQERDLIGKVGVERWDDLEALRRVVAADHDAPDRADRDRGVIPFAELNGSRIDCLLE